MRFQYRALVVSTICVSLTFVGYTAERRHRYLRDQNTELKNKLLMFEQQLRDSLYSPAPSLDLQHNVVPQTETANAAVERQHAFNSATVQ